MDPESQHTAYLEAFSPSGSKDKRPKPKTEEWTSFLDQWFSTILMLWPFNTVIHVVLTPNYETIFIATS